MAVINPTAANIRVDASQPVASASAGEAIDRFQLVYRGSTGLKLAVTDSAEEAKVVGMSFVTAATNGLVSYVSNGGFVDSTSSLWAATEFYFLSSTAGKMCLLSDLSEDELVTLIGYAVSPTRLKLNILPTGLPRVV